MSHTEKSLHHPSPRRSYRRFLIACAAIAMALALLPRISEAQQCPTSGDCSCTPLSDRTFYPMGPDDGLGFATPQAECDYLPLIGFAPEGVRAIGYLGIDYHHNGCIRGRRSLSQKSLAKGWRAWGTPDAISVSGKPGTHIVMAWSKKDADGKTQAVIDVYNTGIYRTSGMNFFDLSREIDHLTFCRFDNGPPITVPTQNGQPDGPACCGTPYPKIPGERCTYRPDVLPGRQCRGPR
jgi:hypothetical protein